MKILDVFDLAIPEVKVIRFGRFPDNWGYFSEQYRLVTLKPVTHCPSCAASASFRPTKFLRAGTIRGLHFQWNPYMGKLVRTIRGHMIDVVLDVRKGSPTYGRIIAHDMPAQGDEDYAEWIWVPPGFAHGNTFPTDTVIEYSCSGSTARKKRHLPASHDIDWSLCIPELADQFQTIAQNTALMTDKDRNGLTVAQWAADSRSDVFLYDDHR